MLAAAANATATPAPASHHGLSLGLEEAGFKPLLFSEINPQAAETYIATHEERWGALDDVTHQLNQQLGKTALMTGAQFALLHIDESQKQPKAKCPFTPQREMISKLWGAERPAKPVQGTLF